MFPRSLVEGWIDGREAVAAHGPREMPVWGYSFREDMELDENTETNVHERVSLLVEYLEFATAALTPAQVAWRFMPSGTWDCLLRRSTLWSWCSSSSAVHLYMPSSSRALRGFLHITSRRPHSST